MSEILLIPASEYHSLKKEVMRISDLMAEIVDQLKKSETLKGDTYLSTSEACAKYKISKPTLNSRKEKGHIVPLRTGKILRWAQSDLDRLFDKR